MLYTTLYIINILLHQFLCGAVDAAQALGRAIYLNFSIQYQSLFLSARFLEYRKQKYTVLGHIKVNE